ncbi:MAG: nucleotidyltransferase domain-containing protein [Streptosporangiaceae bacterium]
MNSPSDSQMNSPTNARFGPVLAVRSVLSALTVPYWIAGGWAIDLAVGRVTRDHADVDIMLLERDEHALRTDLTQVDVQLIGRDGQPGPWPAGRRLLAGPGPARPRSPVGADRLVLHSENLPLPTEVLLASAAGGSWVYYRGARCISRPLADITRNRDGIPFLAPEVVLLFKSRSQSGKDQRDVETALPVLSAEQRSWLQDTLEHLPRGQTAPLPRR